MAKEYIERGALRKRLEDFSEWCRDGRKEGVDFILDCSLPNTPAADVVEVVRCQNCVHSEPLDRNCELSTSHYLHCKIWRGEETKNIWHKYKKYYKDYSIVDRFGFCSDGEKK